MTTAPPSFPSADSLEAFATQLEAADRDGRVRRMGNWSPAQAAWHIAEFMRASIDGFGFRAPLVLRLLVRPLRFMLFSRRPTPRGIPLRGPMEAFIPSPDLTPDEGFGHLRDQLRRMHAGVCCREPSPLFGRLSHEQWMIVHLKHAAHHFARFEVQDPEAP